MKQTLYLTGSMNIFPSFFLLHSRRWGRRKELGMRLTSNLLCFAAEEQIFTFLQIIHEFFCLKKWIRYHSREEICVCERVCVCAGVRLRGRERERERKKMWVWGFTSLLTLISNSNELKAPHFLKPHGHLDDLSQVMIEAAAERENVMVALVMVQAWSLI